MTLRPNGPHLIELGPYPRLGDIRDFPKVLTAAKRRPEQLLFVEHYSGAWLYLPVQINLHN